MTQFWQQKKIPVFADCSQRNFYEENNNSDTPNCMCCFYPVQAQCTSCYSCNMWLHVIKNVFFEVNGLAVNEVITPLELTWTTWGSCRVRRPCVLTLLEKAVLLYAFSNPILRSRDHVLSCELQLVWSCLTATLPNCEDPRHEVQSRPSTLIKPVIGCLMQGCLAQSPPDRGVERLSSDFMSLLLGWNICLQLLFLLIFTTDILGATLSHFHSQLTPVYQFKLYYLHIIQYKYDSLYTNILFHHVYQKKKPVKLLIHSYCKHLWIKKKH